MAEYAEVSQWQVRKVWAAADLKPHRIKSFKISNDPEFAEKVIDVVGLYLNPPDNAMVLSVDEKTQIQALDRTQPMLPMRPGQIERRTHDYKRHGTTSLYAAFNVATGEVLGRVTQRHRAKEFLDFLHQIERSTPRQLDLHLILDNSSTHKTEAIQHFLSDHPRFHFHFTPTSASWLNAVETWFSKLDGERSTAASSPASKISSTRSGATSRSIISAMPNPFSGPNRHRPSSTPSTKPSRPMCKQTSRTGH